MHIWRSFNVSLGSKHATTCVQDAHKNYFMTCLKYFDPKTQNMIYVHIIYTQEPSSASFSSFFHNFFVFLKSDIIFRRKMQQTDPNEWQFETRQDKQQRIKEFLFLFFFPTFFSYLFLRHTYFYYDVVEQQFLW